MYREGSGKGILSIFIGLFAVVAACYWRQTLFLLRFLKDLAGIDSKPFWLHLARTFHLIQ
jgi:hypothetical protein